MPPAVAAIGTDGKVARLYVPWPDFTILPGLCPADTLPRAAVVARLSPDRVLLYRWGDMDVSEQRSISGYQVRSFVDTLSGYSGNVVRTPFVCAVRDDFVVVSLTLGQIQSPKR